MHCVCCGNKIEPALISVYRKNPYEYRDFFFCILISRILSEYNCLYEQSYVWAVYHYTARCDSNCSILANTTEHDLAQRYEFSRFNSLITQELTLLLGADSLLIISVSVRITHITAGRCYLLPDCGLPTANRLCPDFPLIKSF
jgi:hypothetical protein